MIVPCFSKIIRLPPHFCSWHSWVCWFGATLNASRRPVTSGLVVVDWKRGVGSVRSNGNHHPDAPWCWYIYLQKSPINDPVLQVNIPYMDHLGWRIGQGETWFGEWEIFAIKPRCFPVFHQTPGKRGETNHVELGIVPFFRRELCGSSQASSYVQPWFCQASHGKSNIPNLGMSGSRAQLGPHKHNASHCSQLGPSSLDNARLPMPSTDWLIRSIGSLSACKFQRVLGRCYEMWSSHFSTSPNHMTYYDVNDVIIYNQHAPNSISVLPQISITIRRPVDPDMFWCLNPISPFNTSNMSRDMSSSQSYEVSTPLTHLKGCVMICHHRISAPQIPSKNLIWSSGAADEAPFEAASWDIDGGRNGAHLGHDIMRAGVEDEFPLKILGYLLGYLT